MVSVAHIVEDIIRKKPFLQEALARGIVNNAALADELIPQIERELDKKVKFAAVNMAIRRYAEKIEKTFVPKAKFDNTCDIAAKSDLIGITVYKMEDAQQAVRKVYDIVDLKKGDFLTITQGVHEVMLITNRKYEKTILQAFSKKLLKKTVKNLSSVTVSLPANSLKTVGLFYIVTRAIAWENINIVDVVSTLTEMTIIVHENDTSRTYETLKQLVKENN
ncbi:MAG: hypothetical protein KKG59_02385 [Nanoarchaeota archaeon]|nr:hypothetical protein [Nanoarchaeota archaeon]